jgi:hypothetical protein
MILASESFTLSECYAGNTSVIIVVEQMESLWWFEN